MKKTVRQSVKDSFFELPDKFSVLQLIAKVREKTNRPYLTDGTLLRRLRELRSDGELDYRVIDTVRAIYEKIKKVKQLEIF